jgi:chromosome segregation ATPase
MSRDSSGDNKTEEKRLKFIINQLKGNVQEADMRAGAAERRVAILQKTLKEMKENAPIQPNGEQVEKTKDVSKQSGDDNNKSVIEQLSLKIKELTESINTIKSQAEKDLQSEKTSHENERIEWDLKYNQTITDLKAAESELSQANEEKLKLNKMMEDLKKENEVQLQELRAKSKLELETTKKELNEELKSANIKAQEERESLTKQIMDLRGTLVKTEVKVVDLEMELAKTIKDMNNEIISTKAAAKKELDATLVVLLRTKRDAEEKEVVIEKLEAERASIRKMMRLQAGLVKNRVGNLFRKRSRDK